MSNIPIRPMSVLTAMLSTFLLLTIIPISLMTTITFVVGLSTANPTPNLFNRSNQLESRGWDWESNCKSFAANDDQKCYAGFHRIDGSKTVDLSLFDHVCHKLGGIDQAPLQTRCWTRRWVELGETGTSDRYPSGRGAELPREPAGWTRS